jgi:hypothetical protein
MTVFEQVARVAAAFGRKLIVDLVNHPYPLTVNMSATRDVLLMEAIPRYEHDPGGAGLPPGRSRLAMSSIMRGPPRVSASLEGGPMTSQGDE